MNRIYLKLSLASFLILGPGLAYGAYHTVTAGDTLSQIAEDTYGNWVKFNDIWKMNQDLINDPHWIYPGQKLRLLAGDDLKLFAQNNGLSMPEYDDDIINGSRRSDSESDSPEGPVRRRRGGRSEEWRLLPQQSWETFVFKKNASVDPFGFDRRSVVAKRVADKSAATITLSSDRIAISGEITQARSDYDRLFLGEQVFIRGDEQLQVNSTYSVTTGPQKIVAPKDGRVGFGYDLTGKIRIIGVRDGVFIGTITAIYYPIRRGQLLIPEVKDYLFPKPVAAATAIQASIVIPEGAREDMLGEQKIVYVDAGSQDGVQAGTIFRHYLHTDPHTHEAISAKDFLIEAELKVLSVNEKFSVAIILHTNRPLRFGDDLVALTDLHDFEKNQGLQTLLQDPNKPTTVDDLDQMDANDGLGEKENLDLRQLEKWQKPLSDSGTGMGVSNDEIQKIETHDHAKDTFDIGHEPAPDDGTSNKGANMDEPKAVSPSTAPSTSTSTTGETVPELDKPVAQPPATAPDATAPPASSTVQPSDSSTLAPPTTPPPLMSDPSLDSNTPSSLESSAPAPSTPAPVQDKATGTPSGTDPFSGIPESSPTQ